MDKDIKAINERLAELYARFDIVEKKIEIEKSCFGSSYETGVYNSLRKLYVELINLDDEIGLVKKEKEELLKNK